jgi:hypothetical protein
MRIPALTILIAITVLAAAAPAQAQTFGGNYPFCVQYYSRGGSRYTDCAYSSMEQCQAAASGRSAMCLTNPYCTSAQVPRGPRQPRRAC